MLFYFFSRNKIGTKFETKFLKENLECYKVYYAISLRITWKTSLRVEFRFNYNYKCNRTTTKFSVSSCLESSCLGCSVLFFQKETRSQKQTAGARYRISVFL